jgi:hypothetical protein
MRAAALAKAHRRIKLEERFFRTIQSYGGRGSAKRPCYRTYVCPCNKRNISRRTCFCGRENGINERISLSGHVIAP